MTKGILGSDIIAEIKKYNVDPVFEATRNENRQLVLTIKEPCFDELSEAIWAAGVDLSESAEVE